MPRPKKVSDFDVLNAALEVLAEKGAGFTLSDVASRVALSRATLIQRFGDRDAILHRMARHEVDTTRAWLAELPVNRGKDNLWQFLVEIVESMGSGEGFSARVAIAALEARDPILRACANERYQLVQAAIAARFAGHQDAEEIAAHLHAIIAGATMQWVASDGRVPLPAFVLERLETAFKWLPID
jgi:AcrR family transcriptional regulator